MNEVASTIDSKDCMLVVIDMQPRYNTSRGKKLRKTVAREITTAKSLGWWIIFLEFGGTDPHSQTYADLTELVSGYPRSSPAIIKLDSDGSRLIKALCLRRLLYPKRFRVCGVNIGACVHATVDGLVAEFPDATIDVVRVACNDKFPNKRWQTFMRHPRVWVV